MIPFVAVGSWPVKKSCPVVRDIVGGGRSVTQPVVTGHVKVAADALEDSWNYSYARVNRRLVNRKLQT
jgi:hypothetical protein